MAKKRTVRDRRAAPRRRWRSRRRSSPSPSRRIPKQKLEKPGIEAEMEQKPQWRAPQYKAAGKLEGKVALVTGGDSGIGRAVAYLYAREGADVAIVHLPEEQRDADETRQAIEEEGRRCLASPATCATRVLPRGRRADRARAGQPGHPGLQRRLAEPQEEPRRRSPTRSGTAPSAPTSTPTSTSPRPPCQHMQPGSAIIATSSETGLHGREGAAGLLGDQGGDQRLHQGAGAAADPRRGSASTPWPPARSGRR